MTTRSNFAIPSFANTTYLAPSLVLPTAKENVKFSCKNPSAALKYSEPVTILHLFFNPSTGDLKAVGSDGNVRVCKTSRMNEADVKPLMEKLKAVKKEKGLICFEAAGGFSPDKWFQDIVQS